MIKKHSLSILKIRYFFKHILAAIALLFFSTAVSAVEINNLNSRISNVLEKLNQVNRFGSDTYVLGNNSVVENCKSFPHYSVIRNQNLNGHVELIQDLKTAIDRGVSCMLNPENKFADVHQKRALRLLELLEDETLQKTYACVPGIDQAGAYSNYENFDIRDPGFMYVRNYMPNFPAVVFDTNVLANNQSLYVEKNIVPRNIAALHLNFVDYANETLKHRGLRLEGDLPIDSTAMLTFHEMLHWVDYKHGQYHLLDEVRLIQAACFGENVYSSQSNIKISDLALKILSDENYWNIPTENEKKMYAVKKSYAADMYEILDYTYQNQDFSLVQSIPEDWIKYQESKLKIYGPKDSVDFVLKIIQKIKSNPELQTVYSNLTSLESTVYIGHNKNENPDVNFYVFNSLANELKSYGLFSGQETREDYIFNLERKSDGYSKYFSYQSATKHQIPFPLSPKDWIASVMFNVQNLAPAVIGDSLRTYPTEEVVFSKLFYLSEILKYDSPVETSSKTIEIFLKKYQSLNSNSQVLF